MFCGVAQHFGAQQLVAAVEADALLLQVGPPAAELDLAVV
jgi:hypothetical protein